MLLKHCVDGVCTEEQPPLNYPFFSCECFPGFETKVQELHYEGKKYCDADIDECDPNPCNQGVECTQLTPPFYECTVRSKICGRLRNLVIFEVFGVKILPKKQFFRNAQ